MAWRIDRAVVRGEIDNTLRGVTTGKIWLAGHEEPLRLTLEGDCWRDLAGTRLTFVNPQPKEDLGETEALQVEQTGVIGDMTASRRMRVASVESERDLPQEREEGEPPYSWRNALSLEWFSEANGRVLLEAVDFQLTLTDHEWTLDIDEEQAQKMANLQAMRDFMAVMIRRRERSTGDSEREADEFEWEERLKESDRLADAYQEVLEKYMDDPDAEQKEAFVMGWDGLLEAMAAQHEGEAEAEEEGQDESAPFDLSTFDGDDDFSQSESGAHPLQQSAQELALRTMELLPRGEDEGDCGGRLAANLVQISAKLAGALNHSDEETGPESGYVLAILKRCMNWLNESVADCQHLLDVETDPARRKSLDSIRRELFGIRDGVVALRREWKQH